MHLCDTRRVVAMMRVTAWQVDDTVFYVGAGHTFDDGNRLEYAARGASYGVG